MPAPLVDVTNNPLSTCVLHPQPLAIPQPSREELERMVARNRGPGTQVVAEFHRSVEPDLADAQSLNRFAWYLATVSQPELRDPDRAVELAKRAAEMKPTDRPIWNTLGAAEYRAGEWKKSIVALEKSMELRGGGGDAYDWYFLAMAHWKLGQKAEALSYFEKAVAWSERANDKDLGRLKKEAAELLGMSETPPPAELPARP